MFDTDALPRLYGNVLLIAFIAVALWESFHPRRRDTRPTVRRWGQNGVLVVLTDVVGLLIRLTPLAAAAAVSASPYGLLNRPGLPLAGRVIIAFVLLDLVRYGQHRLMHKVPALWRLHQVHHSDDHFDLTTGVRFHPVEVALTQPSYLAAIVLLAPPLEAVLAFELATVVQNFFLHANISLPNRLERYLRRMLITPEMHRVHHSVRLEEQNTNFGFMLPLWDRVLGTYLAGPAGGHDDLRFGLKELEGRAPLTIGALLKMPFAWGSQPRPYRVKTIPGVDQC